jgi:hypothetical protein
MSKEGDGTNDYMYHNVVLLSTYPFTISFWAWLDQRTSASQASWSQTAGNNSYFRIGATKNALEWQFQVKPLFGTANNISIGSNLPDTGAWHHICCWANAVNDRKIYVDYTNTNTTATSKVISFINPVTSLLGRYKSSLNEPFNGRIAEQATWDVKLTDREIKALAEGFSPLFIRRANLKEYFPFIRNVNGLIQQTSITEVHSPPVNVHPRIIYPANRFNYFKVAASLPSENYYHVDYLPRYEYPLSGRLIG